jgi:beta-hydroxylase
LTPVPANVAQTSEQPPPPPRLGVKLGKLVLRVMDRFFARHSRVPATPFIDAAYFPELLPLKAAWREIDAELGPLLEARDRIPAFHQLSPDQVRISRGDHWKTFAFYVFGDRVDANCAQCPRTAELLDRLPGIQNAWFSILAPGYHIPPHRGPSRAVVRCHLGLRIPAARERCWIRVDTSRSCWAAGELLCFDDTYDHEVHNDTDETRVVLFIDIERPLDGIGVRGREALLWLMRRSKYVKSSKLNLDAWNRRLGIRAD